MRSRSLSFALAIALVGAGSTGVVLGTTTASAAACASPTVVSEQPVDNGVLKVARLAGGKAGAPDVWDMRYDIFVCNPLGELTVPKVKIEQLRGGVVTNTVEVVPLKDDAQPVPIVPANADAAIIQARDQNQYAFPLPDSIRVTTALMQGGSTAATFVKTYSVAVHENAGPLKGYFFPMRQSDLGEGEYWWQARHAEPNFQRWGHDLKVERWDKKTGKWTELSADASTAGNLPEDSVTFNRNVYAMSDGEVIGCNRGAYDNKSDEAIGAVPGGNVLWIRNGDETTLYAHLKKDSIPFDLCPHNDDKEYQVGNPDPSAPNDPKHFVKAGQLLAQTGNSGYSRGGHSHIHIHVFKGLPAIWGGSEAGLDSDARPQGFVNVQVQPATGANVKEALWQNLTSPKQLPYFTRILPNDCNRDPSSYAGRPQVVQFNVQSQCFSDMYNAMVQANFRPVSLDFFQYKNQAPRSNSIWRPADGTPWLLYYGLTTDQLQNIHNQAVLKDGFRYLSLENYRQGKKLRHAAILVKQAGPSFTARSGMSHKFYLKYRKTQKKQGRKPQSISMAVVKGKRYYATLYTSAAVGAWSVRTGTKTSKFQKEYNAQYKKGRKLVSVDGYRYDGTSYLASVWWSQTSEPKVKHGQKLGEIASLTSQQLQAGRYARRITGYQQGNKIRYAGLWRVPPDTSILTGPNNTFTPSASATFTFASAQPLTTFECRLDSIVFQACTSPATYGGLAFGTHNFAVRAKGPDGDVDPSPATAAWVRLQPIMPG